MAVLVKSDGGVPSLFKKCAVAVVSSLQQHEDDLSRAPFPIKQACLGLMSKRGLITDENIAKLSAAESPTNFRSCRETFVRRNDAVLPHIRTQVLNDRIRVLDLSACDVTDASLFKLSMCRNLCKVDLNAIKSSTENITSAGVASLSQSCPGLQMLYLRRCINLTDEGVIAVSRNCPGLRELNTGGCFHLTDASLEALGQNSRFLTAFNFSKAAVRDMGVYSLVSGVCSSSLKEIDMSGCQHLTDEAVEGVVQMCPQIKILIFHGCPLITENARVALEELIHNGSSAMKQITFTVY